MGGMITIRLALDDPKLFRAIVLVGPLIHVGPSTLLRSLPMNAFWPSLNHLFQWALKQPLMRYFGHTQIGSTNIHNITSDAHVKQLLLEDDHRHFGGIYVHMLSTFSAEMTNNLQDLGAKMTTPFCVLFGQDDPLCNIRGGWDMYFGCTRVSKADKIMMEFENAAHQLYLEIP